jgi:hypothetical protein
MTISVEKKLRWFDAGAEALRRQRHETQAVPQSGPDAQAVYVCPICIQAFPRSSVASGVLTADHVPPECFGGREMVLTCSKCNHTAGSVLDAHARRKEDVDAAMQGHLLRPHKVKVITGGPLNARLTSTDGQLSVTVPDKINRPGAKERIRWLRAGDPITVEHEKYSELAANISWLRSGYLLLFAVFGYPRVFDPAMQIVRRQILDPNTSLMTTFMSRPPEPYPWSELQRSEFGLLEMFEPVHLRCWAVQFGRCCVLFPLAGDVSFYERLGRDVTAQAKPMQGTIVCDWPSEPCFGLPDREMASG